MAVVALLSAALPACGREGPGEPLQTGRTPGPYALRDITDAVGAVGEVGVGTRFNDLGDVLTRGRKFLSGGAADSPPATCVGALALNNRSHVLCLVSGAPGQTLPYVSNFAIWDGQSFIPLAAPDTFGTSIFYGWTLNDADAVAGTFSYIPTFGNPACQATAGCDVIWRNGQPTFLPYLSYLGVSHMNDRFMLVQSETGCTRGMSQSIKLYDVTSGAVHVLGSCPERANDMNAQGWVVGSQYSDYYDPTPEAVLHQADGVIRLGEGDAAGINDAGVVVGTVDGKAFRWKDGAMSFLTEATNDTSWTVTRAFEINNRGQILAQADDSVHAKFNRSVILTPDGP